MALVYTFPEGAQMKSGDIDGLAEMCAEDAADGPDDACVRDAAVEDAPGPLRVPRPCGSQPAEQSETRLSARRRRRRFTRVSHAAGTGWRRRPRRSRWGAADLYRPEDDPAYDLIQPVLVEWDEDAEDWEEVWSEVSDAQFWQTMHERMDKLFRAEDSGEVVEPTDPGCTRGAVVLAFDPARASAKPSVGGSSQGLADRVDRVPCVVGMHPTGAMIETLVGNDGSPVSWSP